MPPIEYLLADLNALGNRIRRLGSDNNVLVHGDAHFANAMFSAEPRACLLDWGMPMIGFGEIDLAHALALNLPQRLRREWEGEMLDAYASAMTAARAPSDRERLYARYRLGVLYSFVSPVLWWRAGMPESQWQPAFNNVMSAAQDLGLLK